VPLGDLVAHEPLGPGRVSRQDRIEDRHVVFG